MLVLKKRKGEGLIDSIYLFTFYLLPSTFYHLPLAVDLCLTLLPLLFLPNQSSWRPPVFLLWILKVPINIIENGHQYKLKQELSRTNTLLPTPRPRCYHQYLEPRLVQCHCREVHLQDRGEVGLVQAYQVLTPMSVEDPALTKCKEEAEVGIR